MQLRNLVKQAMLDKAPALYRELESKGTLQQAVSDRAEEISDAVMARAEGIARAQGYGKLMKSDPMKAVGVKNSAKQAAREEVLSQMLEFPQDGTSPPSQA